MTDAILVLNAGSSSIKFALYPLTPSSSRPLIRGKIESIGRAPAFRATDGKGQPMAEGELAAIDATSNHQSLTMRLLDWLEAHDQDERIVAIGHRVVHGGREFAAPVRIDRQSLNQLETLTSLAPLHQPHNLAPIDALMKRDSTLLQVACFDTAFHRTQNPLAETFALPRSYTDEGVIRYGFHGISYEYIASVLPHYLDAQADGRCIIAHLGNGASLCAMKERKSVATSMGFTALDGLVMGTRCGSLDPGVVLYLMQERGMTAEEIQHLLYNESGLRGISGISNNMQVLMESDRPEAKEAIDLFCYRAACEIGSLMVPLGGLDSIVFTAGIGENAAAVRSRICGFLHWLSIELDDDANRTNAPVISTANSTITVRVIPTDEEKVIAEAARNIYAATAR
jgi:acetate kinase